MRVLRLADMKVPAMDKLYYYVRNSEKMMVKHLPAVESTFMKVATPDFLGTLTDDGVALGSYLVCSDDDDSDQSVIFDDDSVVGAASVEIDETISVSSVEEGSDDDDKERCDGQNGREGAQCSETSVCFSVLVF